MIPSPPALPAASQYNAPLWRRVLARLAEPPRWARQASSWSFSAAFFTAIFLVATLYSMSWGCKCGPNAHLSDRELLDYTRLFSLPGWPEADEVGVTLLLLAAFTLSSFLPFRFTVGVHRLFFRLYGAGRRGAMIWCAAFHTALHVLIFSMMGVLQLETCLAPLGIGLLWGAWLPHVEPARLGKNHPNRPFEPPSDERWRSVCAMHDARADDVAQAGTALTTSSNIPSNSAPER